MVHLVEVPERMLLQWHLVVDAAPSGHLDAGWIAKPVPWVPRGLLLR